MLRLRLKDLYKEKGVTQKDVSEATGIRQATLGGLANNNRMTWDVLILKRLCDYFEIEDISQMIEYVSPKELNERLANMTLDERFEKLYNENSK